MKLKHIFYTIISLLLLTSCDSYLDKPDPDSFDDRVDFWVKEQNFRVYAQRFYTDLFPGYGIGNARGPVFTFAPWADDQISSDPWTANIATSGNSWSFTLIRNANILVNRAETTTVLTKEQQEHWLGVGRLFRALSYAKLAESFGDVPWFDAPLNETDEVQMFRPRDPLPFVVEKMIEDFDYAAAHIRVNDGSQQVHRDLAKALMARHLLYFGTFLKYHKIDDAVSKKALEKAVWAAEEVVKGPYQIVDDYRKIFTSEDLASNKEVIFSRQYVTAKATHSIVTYQNLEAQTGLSLNAFNSYLSVDGLPIKQSPAFNYASDQGRRNFSQVYANRDPRLYATFNDTLRIINQHGGYSTTGIVSWKYLPEVVTTDPVYTSTNNTTDAPIIRLGEVLLILAEAKAELGTITQDDINKTINKLRNRNIPFKGTIAAKLPNVVLTGSSLAVEGTGVIIDDPDRDPSVSPLLWEIRRERRVELMFEGFRRSDLRRWAKFEYLNNETENGVPKDNNLGVWIDQADYPTFNWTKILAGTTFYTPDPNNKKQGYIYHLSKPAQQRSWVSGMSFFERQYLNSVPLDQINMYKEFGVKLTQNPYWND